MGKIQDVGRKAKREVQEAIGKVIVPARPRSKRGERDPAGGSRAIRVLRAASGDPTPT